MTLISIELEIDVEVKISKYNPAFRNMNGEYTIDEWTSVSDVVKYDGFDIDIYLETERKYWVVLHSILKSLSISELKLFEVEMYDLNKGNESNIEKDSAKFCQEIDLTNGMMVNLSEFEKLFEAAMREVVWFKACDENGTFVHFGYDFYLYCGSKLNFRWENVDGIFVEEMRSPYHDE